MVLHEIHGADAEHAVHGHADQHGPHARLGGGTSGHRQDHADAGRDSLAESPARRRRDQRRSRRSFGRYGVDRRRYYGGRLTRYEFPTITIRPLDDYALVREAIGRFSGYDWLIFTSVNGVRHFWAQLEEAGRDSRALGNAA